MNPAYLFALGANLCFSTGTLIFTHFTHRLGSLWMNYFKAFVASLGFCLTISFFYEWHSISFTSLLYFFLSGSLGLFLGDIFLLLGFKEIGPGRTLMLFGMQPILIGSMSYLVLGQEIDTSRFWAILMFIACLFIFSVESFKKNKSWGLKGIGFAFIGVFLDAIGIVMTRYSFDHSPEVIPLEGNFYRALGAIVCFGLYSFFRPIRLKDLFFTLTVKQKSWVIAGSILGTYLSLFLYLTALKTAHLASLSGITITSPLFASLIECLLEKKWPGPYLILAFLFFLGGMGILIM